MKSNSLRTELVVALLLSREKPKQRDLLQRSLAEDDLADMSRTQLLEFWNHAQIESAEEDLQKWERQGIQAIAQTDQAYPKQLESLYRPPAILFYRGVWSAISLQKSLAIVGARNASPQAYSFARRCGKQADQCGLNVISGLAIGIDGAAHEGVVGKASPSLLGGHPVAVLAHGLDRIYPARHRGLASRLLDSGGILLSEFEPGVAPLPRNFLQRNQIIAGLSSCVLVVAAARRSGSLNTARCALEIGREVVAVPGSVVDAGMEGCNRLIQDGAAVLLHPEEIKDLGLEVASSCKEGSESKTGNEITEFLDSHESVELEIFKRKFTKVDSTTLLQLELEGVLKVSGGMVSRA